MKRYAISVPDRLTRLRRIEGQVRGLQHMIERGDAFVDILTQIKSVTRALDRPPRRARTPGVDPRFPSPPQLACGLSEDVAVDEFESIHNGFHYLALTNSGLVRRR